MQAAKSLESDLVASLATFTIMSDGMIQNLESSRLQAELSRAFTATSTAAEPPG